MSREKTKESLLHYLHDDQVRVIALKGLWGTGKTHLWEEVKSGFPAMNENSHLYASCFGVESVEHIKSTLFQSSLGKKSEALSGLKRYAGAAIDVTEKLAAKWLPGGEGLATLMGSVSGLVQATLIDNVLHDRLIVLDDIERRSDGLPVEALLGFIDLLKRNNCKILIILNEEPIEKSHLDDWRTLKEKCVDREIALLTTAGEAADMGLSPDVPLRLAIRGALIKHAVTNIRVVQRIDRVVSTLLEGKTELQGVVEEELLPAIVLLTALNFNAVPGGPNLDLLVAEWTAWCMQGNYVGEKSKSPTAAAAFALHAKLSRDIDFLNLVVKHLLTGHRLQDEFDLLFKARQKQAASTAAEAAAIKYIESVYFDPDMNDQDFIALAERYQSAWQQLSADKISAIAIDLEKRGADQLASEIVEQWAQRRRGRPQLWLSSLHPVDNMHPIVKDTLIDGNRQLSSPPTLLQAVKNVCSGGWNPADEQVINGVSENDMVRAICQVDREGFSSFVYFYHREITNPLPRAETKGIFAAGVATFLKAARRIVDENTSPRRVELLQLHFGEHLRKPGI
ncbi:Uncharacterised protein [Delftia tsuruhatensis]|uniref:KAP family NTPase n=1 Tax=Delftia tsuruhatensis TaxID=180282 RepID=UPI001E7EE6C5|nr:KAP family NTPase [Delftia tsuruhatensis]CAB5670372.1 Uncharacterised protein [Delftia tsuruhatensis]CAC9682998.1 Uncharacterised protein [Delftia tsuruhatensis]